MHDGTNAQWQRWKIAVWNPIFMFSLHIFSIRSSMHLQEIFPNITL